MIFSLLWPQQINKRKIKQYRLLVTRCKIRQQIYIKETFPKKKPYKKSNNSPSNNVLTGVCVGYCQYRAIIHLLN